MDLATWFAHIVSFTPKDLSSLFVLFSNLNMKKKVRIAVVHLRTELENGY